MNAEQADQESKRRETDMKYVDNNTGYFYTTEELKKLFEQFRWEMKRHYDTFDEYIDDMKQKKNLREVDQDEIEEGLAEELYEMIAFGWTDEEAKEDKEAFLERVGYNYTDVLTEDTIWEIWQNVWEESQAE